MKKIYLDVCTLCRPFDNQNDMRIRLETDAYYLILQAIGNKRYDLIVSSMHLKELESISDIKERIQIIHFLDEFGKTRKADTDKVKKRADELILQNFGIADAVHLAFAEQLSDYLITCDDKFEKKGKRIKTNIEVINPIAFCLKEELK
jgi:predicted nucleic acid-binding protein